MTVKSVVDSASIRVFSNAPAAVFASSETIALEMRDLVNEVAKDIAGSAEWRSLTKIATMGGATSFPKPVDYDRMLTAQGIQNRDTWFWGYFAFQSVSEYMMAVNGQIPLISPGGWILLDDEFKFYPMPTGTATFPYISNEIWRDVDGNTKRDATHDDDELRLSERLLTLGLIWRYKAQKGFEYAEDLANYEKLFYEKSNEDKGARTVRPDRKWRWPRSNTAYTNWGM